MADELERIRKEHQKIQNALGTWCLKCRKSEGVPVDWPCDVAKVLKAYESAVEECARLRRIAGAQGD